MLATEVPGDEGGSPDHRYTRGGRRRHRRYRDALSLKHLTIFPHFPGDTYETAEVQLQRYAEEVRPLID